MIKVCHSQDCVGSSLLCDCCDEVFICSPSGHYVLQRDPSLKDYLICYKCNDTDRVTMFQLGGG